MLYVYQLKQTFCVYTVKNPYYMTVKNITICITSRDYTYLPKKNVLIVQEHKCCNEYTLYFYRFMINDAMSLRHMFCVVLVIGNDWKHYQVPCD